MGAVYLAEGADEIKRQVAIKVDLRRFRQKRRKLADLDHPNMYHRGTEQDRSHDHGQRAPFESSRAACRGAPPDSRVPARRGAAQAIELTKPRNLASIESALTGFSERTELESRIASIKK